MDADKKTSGKELCIKVGKSAQKKISMGETLTCQRKKGTENKNILAKPPRIPITASPEILQCTKFAPRQYVHYNESRQRQLYVAADVQQERRL
jgi:hypothetical protein